jgi:hypothetical protein
LLAKHLGAVPKHYGETHATGSGFAFLLLPYRETPNAEEAAAHALRAVDHWGGRGGLLLSNAGVFDPSTPGLRREIDAPDANDAFGRALGTIEVAFTRNGPQRSIVRLPAPIAPVPEAGALLQLLDPMGWNDGVAQGFDPSALAGLLEPCAQIRLTHLACGPVPVGALAAQTGRPLHPAPPQWGTGWDRLRTQWSGSWGRPDGLASGRRTTLAALTAFAQGAT